MRVARTHGRLRGKHPKLTPPKQEAHLVEGQASRDDAEDAGIAAVAKRVMSCSLRSRGLLNFSPWDEDVCRDALLSWAVRHLGDQAAVLAVDDTGFLKKDTRSAG